MKFVFYQIKFIESEIGLTLITKLADDDRLGYREEVRKKLQMKKRQYVAILRKKNLVSWCIILGHRRFHSQTRPYCTEI